MKRSLVIQILVVQGVLLAIELLTRYDTLVRQVALAVTNLLATTILFLVARRFSRTGRPFPAAAAWLAVAGVWFDAAGNFAHLYANIVWWDKLAHFVATTALAAGLWLVVQNILERRQVHLPAFHFGLYVLSLAVLLAVCYEISEYIGDLLFATHRIPDLYDTADDLLWDLVASAFVVVALPVLSKRKTVGIDQASR